MRTTLLVRHLTREEQLALEALLERLRGLRIHPISGGRITLTATATSSTLSQA